MRHGFRHGLRWTILGLLLLTCTVSIYLFIRYLSESGPDFAVNRVLTLVLSSAIVVLVLGIAAVLIRNLVRLIMDRKRGILGSRLRTKLVFFFLILVLPPAVVLFYGSATIIKMTVDAVLKTPVDSVTRYAQQIVDDWTDTLQAQCLWEAESIARSVRAGGYLRADRQDDLDRLVEAWRGLGELRRIVVTRGSEVVTRVDDPRLGAAVRVDGAEPLTADGIAAVLDGDGPVTRLDYLGRGLLVHAAAPIAPASGDGAPEGVVWVGAFLAPGIVERLESISSATEAYRQFRAQRKELIALYLSLIGLIFLVTVFGGTWMGFYLSRRITGPVQELAAATREIAAGNLGVRVASDVGDEVGTLVEAFNEMAAQLQESQEVITRSTAELRKSNRALDERRRYIERLLANLSTAVVSTDEDGTVTTTNPAVEEILGVSIRPGDDIRRALSGDSLGPLLELVEEAARSRAGEVRRNLVVQPRAESLSIAVQLSRLEGPSGERLGTLIMIEDLTDLLRAQRAAAWREVARRIAHEIKNPLTPIQLAAQRLRKKFQERAGDLDEVVPQATASIEKEVGALKTLVDEFSRYARMPEVMPEPADLLQVIESAIDLYRGEPGIRWQTDVDAAIGKVRVDPEQMRRVIINLIDNALAAMNGAGEVRIRVHAPQGPGSVRIEIEDSGPGIPAADRDRMFEPYFSTKRRGTGLGLAIVHRIVTDHKGTIRVEDAEPGGARFVIDIPA